MTDNSLSSQIYLSRDNIRTQITNFLKTYLELENVDLAKSSFLSYLINVLSTLTSNLLFYQSSVYKEFFLVTAQLPETILNLSAFLGYNTQEASYATTNVLITIPFGFEDAESTFTIPSGQTFYAGEIEFVTYYTTSVTVSNNRSAAVTVTEGSKTYNLPVSIDTTSTNTFTFLLPVRQIKTTSQEFQIDSDIELYQFITLDVPIDGKVSSLSVTITDNEAGGTVQPYTEFNSLYLMTSTDYGYVSRRTDTGRKLYFGNGLIGVQPPGGGTVNITIVETEGEDGNIISGAITRGDRVYYTTDAGVTKIVDYTVTNPLAATNGTDEESLDEIRTNAIASLTALGRLVSETDYENVDVVIPSSPFMINSKPVLKRSDVRCNEVQLFTMLEYDGSVVPTRNAFFNIDSSSSYYIDLYVPRGTTVQVNGVNYYTLFDLTLDLINSIANYHYIMYEISKTPILVQSFTPPEGYDNYDIVANELVVTKSGQSAIYELSYLSEAVDYNECTCIMEILETSETFNMTNDGTNKKFTYTFDDYTDISDGELTYYFTISSPTDLLDPNTPYQIARYSTQFVFRQDLKSFMMSNMSINQPDDSTSSLTVTIYDIPVVRKSFYDGINAKEFELNVLQTLMTSLAFENYRMLTDFVNVKFTNTTGTMRNMQYNTVTKSAVINFSDGTFVDPPVIGDRYIVNKNAGGNFEGYDNYIAEWGGSTWSFLEPSTEDIIYVTTLATKYIYTDIGWVIPNYQIPLQIELDVFRSDDYSGTDLDLVNTIKETLVETFEDRFGPNITIYRSEIIKTVQSITGVEHCSLIAPASSVFFEFELDDFTEEELLQYGPEYVYFTEDDISIRVL